MTHKRWMLTLFTLVMVVGISGIGWAQESGAVTITVIHTSDEHGWMNPFTPAGLSSKKDMSAGPGRLSSHGTVNSGQAS